MNKEQILERMDLAIRQDRERFFKIADTLQVQPKYADKLSELEALKEQWRDVTKLEGYPNVTHPLPLPEWFPKVHFASRFEKDVYLVKALEEKPIERAERRDRRINR